MKCVVLLLSLLCQTIFTAISASELKQNFSADFTQTRYLKNSDFSLESSGELAVTASKELYWTQQAPFTMELIVTPKAIYQVVNGKRSKIDNPMMGHVSQIIFAAFRGDMQLLGKSFQIKQNKNKHELTPIEPKLKEIIKTITIKKSINVDFFKLVEVSGNWIEIHFKNYKKQK